MKIIDAIGLLERGWETRVARATLLQKGNPSIGLEHQSWMAPRPRPGWMRGQLSGKYRTSAALLLVYPRADEATVLLTVRHRDLHQHAGQVSLPGGSVDHGEGIADAALREAEEEVALDPTLPRVLGKMTPLQVPASGFVIHPVLSVSEREPELRRAEAEVKRILEPSLAYLSDPAHLEVETWNLRGQVVDVPFFRVDGETVWGATAMILSEFLALLGSPPDPWNSQKQSAEET